MKDGFLLETKYSFKSVKLKQVNLREIMEKDDCADSFIAPNDIEIDFLVLLKSDLNFLAIFSKIHCELPACLYN